MTAITFTTSQLLNRITHNLRKAQELLEERRSAKRSIKELSNLTDRELSDIGISRGDIYSVAHGHYDMTRSNTNLKGWV